LSGGTGECHENLSQGLDLTSAHPEYKSEWITGNIQGEPKVTVQLHYKQNHLSFLVLMFVNWHSRRASRMAARTVLKKHLQLRPYKITSLHELKESGSVKHVQYC
jgi:hypothetical protein